MTPLETTAFLVRGTARGRRFHFQVTASAVGGADPEKNMWEQVPDIDLQDTMRANQDPNWITITFRGIGEMEDQRSVDPDPARSWIDLSAETDQFGMRRAYVNLVATNNDQQLWATMDQAALGLAAALTASANDIQYHNPAVPGGWQNAPLQPDANGRGFWQDRLGTTHHEAGTLFMGDPGSSITDLDGRFHGIANAYVAGPALFPTLGSANPSLTALSLARRTADAIVNANQLGPPATFTPLSLDSASWTMVAAPGTMPQMNRVGDVLESANGYGLYWYTKESFTNFALWVEWRESRRGDNSGVFIRIPAFDSPDALHQADVQGHEIQIDDIGAPDGAAAHQTGAVYALQGPTAFPANPPGQWNSYLIEANGPVINIILNGQLINTYQSSRQPSGFIALQAHGWPSRVQFRNLSVNKLP
jgi:Domain of Unknown Function (DUF1080)/GMC oxidoreductase